MRPCKGPFKALAPAELLDLLMMVMMTTTMMMMLMMMMMMPDARCQVPGP